MTFIILKTRLEGTKRTKITPIFFFSKQKFKQKTETTNKTENRIEIQQTESKQRQQTEKMIATEKSKQ